MMDKNTSVEQLLSFYMGKKHTRPPRIYYQEFEEIGISVMEETI
jgi:hypothetical protein